MSAEKPKHFVSMLFGRILSTIVVLSLSAIGCGTSEEFTEDEWNPDPPVSETARLEYRSDSLMNENRILRQQVDAMAAENRNLTARSAELEVKLNEAISQMELIDAPPPAGTPDNVATSYKAALQTYRNKQYDSAIRQFESLLSQGITEELVPNCHYWIGESMYGLRRYREAITKFEQVTAYVTSGKKSYAQFMIGNSHMALGDKAAAREAFNTFVSTYPTSPLIAKAQQRLSNL